MKIIDPNEINFAFVQSGDMRGLLGWGIRARTKSSWNHSMILHRKGYLVSQGWTYKEIPLSQYLKKGIILKFWTCVDITPEEKNGILHLIKKDLKLPWWRRMYDFPGIIGQAVGIRWINVPWLNYCSEAIKKLAQILLSKKLSKHPNPEDIDMAFKKSPRMEVLGFWLS